MAIHNAQKKGRIYLGTKNVKKAYLGPIQVYSSGNIVTYNVNGATYQEEVDEGASCLSPKTFNPEKSGWEFLGWRVDAEINSSILTEKIMGNFPVMLYATFKQVKSAPISISRPWKDKGDWESSTTITSQYVSDTVISGTLRSSVESGNDYRCDTYLYINGTQIDYLHAYDTTKEKSVWKGLGASNGLVVKVLVHPHSSDRGSGGFNGTVTYTVLI